MQFTMTSFSSKTNPWDANILIKSNESLVFSFYSMLATRCPPHHCSLSLVASSLRINCMYGTSILRRHVADEKHLVSRLVFFNATSHYLPLQLPVGAGFPWNANRPRAHHGFLHRGDARRHGRSHPRQRFGGGPQEALQKAERVRKRLPQQVNAQTHTLGEC